MPGLVAALFDRVERVHGSLLASRTLGLLAAASSGGGLGQRQLLDVVSADDVVMGWKYKKGTVLQFTVRPRPPFAVPKFRGS